MKTYILLIFTFLLVLPFISASIPVYKIDTTADLKIAIYNSDGSPATNAANCTIDIIYPNQSILVIGGQMGYISNGIFDYNINGSLLNVNGVYPCHVKCSQSAQYLYSDFNIEVTPNGTILTPSQTNLIWLGFVLMLVAVIFFFILAIMFKHPGTKIFLMSLSAGTLIVMIGMITANASTYLSQFTSLVDMYNKYYVLMIILAGAAMLGIMIWLIYFAVTTFNKTRGRIPDDD